MAIKIGSNFAYNGKLPNFERDSFKTKAAMKAFAENNIDEGHLSYCEEDGNIYQYKSANTDDATTGKWRLFKTDIVVDAALNGTSINPIQNKAVFDALKLKADATALGAYQPKYKADYIAKADFNYSDVPDGVKVVDLNGYKMSVEQANITHQTYYNGSIYINVEDVNFDVVDMTNININSEMFFKYHISNSTCHNCNFRNAVITQSGYFYNCTFNHSSLESCDECHYCIFSNGTINTPSKTLVTFSKFRNCDIINFGRIICTTIDYVAYLNATMDGYTQTIIENNFADNIDRDYTSGNAPSCGAVIEKLKNYLTKTDAGTTYVTKDSLNNEVNQLVGKINLKLDGTAAASTYLRQDDANTTYAKKTDISNVYKYKGSVKDSSKLPTSGQTSGDVYNIETAGGGYKAGDNVAWNGDGWDNLSGIVDLSAYATKTTTNAINADVKKLMDKAFPFTVKVSLDKTLAKKGTSQPVKVTITPKIGDDNTNVDEIMINGAEYHGATPYAHSDTATTTTTYNVRVRKDDRTAQGSATITFVNPSYDGAVAANFTVTEANIKALTEAVRSGNGGTRTFNLNNQKVCIAYPKSFGAATSIKDANGFDYLASVSYTHLTLPTILLV